MLVKERPVKSLIHEGKEKRKQSIKRSKVKVARQKWSSSTQRKETELT